MKRKAAAFDSGDTLVVEEKRQKTHEEVIEERPVLWAPDDPACQTARRAWPRAPPPADWAHQDLVFQLLECDYTVEKGLPVLRLTGLTPGGHSVLALVHAFSAYFYVGVTTPALKSRPHAFREALNERLAPLVRDKRDQGAEQEEGEEPITRVSLEEKQSLMGYRGDATTAFFKVVCAIPASVAKARSILEEGLDILGRRERFQTYESNVPFVLRFMIDGGLAGCQWAKVAAGSFTPVAPAGRTAHTQLEVTLLAAALQPLPVDAEEWSALAPTRTLSFDLEACGRPGIFPEASIDPVIQIASTVTIQGQAQPLIKTIMVLGTCSPILGADVRCYETEKELLMAWRDLVIEADPDVLTGFNILNFDLPYLLERAAALGLTDFAFFTRLRAVPCKIKDATFQSNQTGKRESKEVTIAGRLVVDMMQVIQKEQKLSSYSLNSVSAHFLGEQKEEMHYSNISPLHAGSKEDRRRIAVYCLKDAALPQRLMDKLMTMVNYTEMARVTGVPFAYLLTRGQGIKVMALIMKHARANGFLIPTLTHHKGATAGEDEGYEGATVIEPKRGYYDRPVATLDFSSLYPSIMMARNLCYTTLLKSKAADAAALGLAPDDYEITPAGDWFVKPSKRKGLLPSVLETLLAARGNAKRLMAKEQDKFKAQVYNGRQLALKVTANSVYGFTGQSVGQLPAVEISASVTAYGREMIQLTKATVEAEYRVEKGYSHDAEVIYGVRLCFLYSPRFLDSSS